MTRCPQCYREWENTTEQAASIRLYGQCIVCCVDAERTDNFSWSIKKVQVERDKFNKNAK